ncbi:ATP-binding protein [Cupriavidus necator]|uniref:ATP-binding protein n=1 Tax=Cupriavidus necator TaxID=106590 RepID=UPI0039C2A986
MSTDFDLLAHTPAQHFRLVLFGVIARITGHCTAGGPKSALAAHPFLADYDAEIAPHVGDAASPWIVWRERVAEWETRSDVHLPLRALRAAGLAELDLELLLAAGLIEEDPRFGQVFEPAATGRDRRPSFGGLLAWWRGGDDGVDRAEAVRHSLLALLRHGLLQVLNPEAPRPEWLLAVPHALWDGLRGDAPSLRWLRHRRHEELCPLRSYVANEDVQARAAALPALLVADPHARLLVRGPLHNGRKTLVGAVAQALGRTQLVAEPPVFDDEANWRLFGLLAVLLNALPTIDCDLTPGETRKLAPLPFADAPLCIATGMQGAWSSGDARALLTVELPLPDPTLRLQHWQAVLPEHDEAALRPLAEAARLTSGNVRRVARTAAGLAALAQRDKIEATDVQQACRAMQSARLETLATRLPGRGGLHELAVDARTREELEALASRCRFRERLAAGGGVSQVNAGVRALLAGVSGTGKTLAARLLASTLGKDLYCVDLSATVNKYLGETEKNLHQAFCAAEELDAVLLLDEGDALMANRTDIGSSNDRYANLETNFLLQRIESFDGILLVTTNAAERIDKAFSRRMDVVIHFRPPDEWRRYDILKLQLGADGTDPDAIDDDLLQQMACRCTLTGGQLRNVVSHARLLALQQDGVLRTEHLYAALQREYRKTGGTCPLRPAERARRTLGTPA